MNITRCQNLPTLLLFSALILFGDTTRVKAQDAPPPVTYPQIVRLSLVQGDLRIARGTDAEHATGAVWEKAAANLPLEDGFNLVTGQGRAEIEFEDTSTVYLGENSALSLDILETTDGVPRTEIALLTGTVTLNVKPIVAGEWFLLRTPANAITIRYPHLAYLRVNSYMDAMTITPQENSDLHIGSSTAVMQGSTGKTFISRNGQPLTPDVSDIPNFSEWDNWVATRRAERAASSSAVMKDAGLTEPLPGLADMQAQGTFFPCEPYGMCWEPSHGWAHPAAMANQPDPPQDTQQGGLLPLQTYGNGTGSVPFLHWEDEDPFPCTPDRLHYLIQDDPDTGQSTVVDSELTYDDYDYDWTVCHAGSWLYWNNRYVWVVGKRHHHPPMHWIKTGHKTGFVPVHPHDVAGKPPLNLKHGLFAPRGQKGGSIERIAYDPRSQVKLLPEPPKEFRKQYFPPLARAEAPHVEAHLAREMSSSNRDPHGMHPGTPITFDHKTQSFMMSRQVTQGGHTTTVNEPFGNHGSSASMHNGGGFGGSRGSGSTGRSGGSAGGSAGHSSSGGGGGGFHGGGGGGGGGSHGGGGGHH